QESRRWGARRPAEIPAVGIPRPTILAFLRISTHPRALERPLRVEEAWYVVEGWLDRPNVWVPAPTNRHREIIAPLLISGKATGNHVPDAHLAALAIEWGLELQSADRGFRPLSRAPLAGSTRRRVTQSGPG